MELDRLLPALSEAFLSTVFVQQDDTFHPIGLFGNDGKRAFVQIGSSSQDGLYFIDDDKVFRLFLSSENKVEKEDASLSVHPIGTVNPFKGLSAKDFVQDGEDFRLPFSTALLYDIPYRFNALFDIPDSLDEKDFSFRLTEDENKNLLVDIRISVPERKAMHILLRIDAFGKNAVFPDVAPLPEIDDPSFRKTMKRLKSFRYTRQEHIVHMDTGLETMRTWRFSNPKDIPTGPECLYQDERTAVSLVQGEFVERKTNWKEDLDCLFRLSTAFFEKETDGDTTSYRFLPEKNPLPANVLLEGLDDDILSLMILVDKDQVAILFHLKKEGEGIRHILLFDGFEEVTDS